MHAACSMKRAAVSAMLMMRGRLRALRSKAELSWLGRFRRRRVSIELAARLRRMSAIAMIAMKATLKISYS